MELILKTPQQRWVYQNIWPHPGSRFGNNWAEEANREKLRWLYKTYAQATGMFPPVVPESWKDAPGIREAAVKIDADNRETGIDENVSGIEFIDLPKPEKKEPEPESGTLTVFTMRNGSLDKYIVIAMAVIAGILILKMIL